MGEIELSSGATSAYVWAPGAPYAEASGYAWGDNPAWGAHNEPMSHKPYAACHGWRPPGTPQT